MIRLIVMVVVMFLFFQFLKKCWLLFHRAVGIDTKTMRYIEPSQQPIHLRHIAVEKIQYLPVDIRQRLQMIDRSFAVYQQFCDEKNENMMVSEDDFVIQKLVNSHLPEAILSYQKIQLNQLSGAGGGGYQNHFQQQKALETLDDILTITQNKIQARLDEYEKKHLQELEAIKGYLDYRDKQSFSK